MHQYPFEGANMNVRSDTCKQLMHDGDQYTMVVIVCILLGNFSSDKSTKTLPYQVRNNCHLPTLTNHPTPSSQSCIHVDTSHPTCFPPAKLHMHYIYLEIQQSALFLFPYQGKIRYFSYTQSKQD